MDYFQRWVDSAGGRREVARLLSVSVFTVRAWCLRVNQPKAHTMAKIARVSGLTFEQVFNSTKPKGSKGLPPC